MVAILLPTSGRCKRPFSPRAMRPGSRRLSRPLAVEYGGAVGLLARGWWSGALVLGACAGGAVATVDTAGTEGTGASTSSTTTSEGVTSEPTTSGTSTSTGTVTGTSTSGVFDLGGADMGARPVVCTPQMDLAVVVPCEQAGPPDSFKPALQWSFGDKRASWVTPLVGNFTDDNGDGAIDLCDTPDVVLVSGTAVNYGQVCEVQVLDGATGTVHFEIPATELVSCTATPAFADIDGDGLPELVTVWNDAGIYRLKAFEHDGAVKWANIVDGNQVVVQGYRESGAVAIHDLDGDGDAEIVFNHEVYDHLGVLLWSVLSPLPGEIEASFGVDLDGDGLLEVVMGHAAFHHDGTLYWDNYPKITSQAIAQVGNLDDDPLPELFITSGQGLWMVEHDGTVKWGPALPTGVKPAGYLTWQRPGTIHDFDGDGVAEYASSSRDFYAVYEGPNPSDVLWKAMILDSSGAAGSTAFDFLGDGVAEAMYADEQSLRIYDGKTGDVLLTQARFSPTLSEYPVVADVDNDGSAEILLVSYSGKPALQVLRDAEDRWVPARRIWNQHAYYVTNVREDGTLPTVPAKHWQGLNTFRTQAQITSGGALCQPE